MNAFYFVTDEAFAYVANAHAQWLRTLWPDCDVHIFIERRDALKSIMEIQDERIIYHYEELSPFLPTGLPHSKYWPTIVFLRMFAPRLLQQYHRLCYIDSDILCMYRDDVLWNIDLPSGIGMVADYATIYRAPANIGEMPRDEWLASINVRSGRYANSGMLLIDPKIFSTYHFEDTLAGYFKEFPAADRFDQDFLNFYFDGVWTEIGPRFNYQAGIMEFGYERIIDPVFMHFCRPVKPWYGKEHKWRAATDPRFYGFYRTILENGGYDIRDYAREFPLPFIRRIRYSLRAWLSCHGYPSRRELRERAKWSRRAALLHEYVNNGLRDGRFADERTRVSIAETTIIPIFDGRFLRPASDGNREPGK